MWSCTTVEIPPFLEGGGEELKAVVLIKNKNNWVLSLKQNSIFPTPSYGKLTKLKEDSNSYTFNLQIQQRLV